MLEMATTFLLRSKVGKGSSARFAFGRQGFCNELGGVFRSSGEWTHFNSLTVPETVNPWSKWRSDVKTGSCQETRKRINRREGKKKKPPSK